MFGILSEELGLTDDNPATADVLREVDSILNESQDILDSSNTNLDDSRARRQENTRAQDDMLKVTPISPIQRKDSGDKATMALEDKEKNSQPTRKALSTSPILIDSTKSASSDSQDSFVMVE